MALVRLKDDELDAAATKTREAPTNARRAPNGVPTRGADQGADRVDAEGAASGTPDENLQHLKSVVLKFLEAPDWDTQQQMIPVLGRCCGGTRPSSGECTARGRRGNPRTLPCEAPTGTGGTGTPSPHHWGLETSSEGDRSRRAARVTRKKPAVRVARLAFTRATSARSVDGEAAAAAYCRRRRLVVEDGARLGGAPRHRYYAPYERSPSPTSYELGPRHAVRPVPHRPTGVRLPGDPAHLPNSHNPRVSLRVLQHHQAVVHVRSDENLVFLRPYAHERELVVRVEALITGLVLLARP